MDQCDCHQVRPDNESVSTHVTTSPDVCRHSGFVCSTTGQCGANVCDIGPTLSCRFLLVLYLYDPHFRRACIHQPLNTHSAGHNIISPAVMLANQPLMIGFGRWQVGCPSRQTAVTAYIQVSCYCCLSLHFNPQQND